MERKNNTRANSTWKEPNLEADSEAEAYRFKRPKLEASGGGASRIEQDDCIRVPISHQNIPQQLPLSSQLTPQQQQVLDLVREGKNVFYSGSGGTGKTFVLEHIVKMSKERFYIEHNSKLLGICQCFACKVAVTALTGIAAIPIGGCTVHRAAGIGIPRCTKDFNKMWKHKQKRRNLSVWIIDEVSMVSAELLEYLEHMIRRIRTQSEDLDSPRKPFGGL